MDKKQNSRLRFVGLSMVAPLVLGLAIFAAYPLVYLVGLAFTQSDLGNRFQKFVGFSNFTWAFEGTIFGTSLFNSIWFAVVASAVQLLLGLFVAYLLHSYVRRGRILRTLILLPLMTPPVMVGIAWKLMLNPAGGWLNGMLLRLGAIDQPISFFGDRFLAFPAIMLADTWQWTPFIVILCFAALQTVPEDVYEAAALDGAYPRRVFWCITLPMIAPALVTVFLLRLVMAFKTFDLVYALTAGGPGNATTLATFEIWRTAMREFDVGLAAAQTLMFAIVVSVVTLPVVALFNRLEART